MAVARIDGPTMVAVLWGTYRRNPPPKAFFSWLGKSQCQIVIPTNVKLELEHAPLYYIMSLLMLIQTSLLKGTKALGWVSPLGPCTVLVVYFWTGGWSVEVKYWRTLKTRGRRAEDGLCLSLPGRWNKLKSIGNTFCPLTSSLIMDTKHISVWEMPDTVMSYVIVYLIHNERHFVQN